MVKIIKEIRQPSTAERFAGAFQNLVSDVPKVLGSLQEEKARKATEISKRRTKVRPGIKSFLSLYGKNKSFNSDMIENLEELSHKYIEQGLEPDDAISAAYQDLFKQEPPQEQLPEKSKFAKSFSGDVDLPRKLGLTSDQGFLKDIGIGVLKGGRLGAAALDFPLQLAKESNYLGRGKDFKTLTDYYDELTGGKGIPTNAVERVAQGIPFGIPGVAATFAEEALHGAGAPESVQRAAGVLSFLAAHRIKVPALKTIIGDAKKVAKKTGQSTEQVLSKAQKESGADLAKVAQGDTGEISKIKSKINYLEDSKTPLTEKVRELPKNFFNKKSAEKERAIFGAKLPESPLEEYYNIKSRNLEKEASKRPETLAREGEIRSRLAPEEGRLYEQLRNQREQIKRIEQERYKASPENKPRLNSLYEFEVKKLDKIDESLKDVQYEMKYGRSRPTEAEIDAQIKKSIKEFEEGIINPTEKSEKAISHQLKLDKQYLDRASKLVSRGELPGEIRPDTFLKMKKKYLDGYNTAIQKAEEEIRELTGEIGSSEKRKLATNKELISRLAGRTKRLKADIVNQTDNIKAMRALERPSGAFYKQQLKSLKKDNALFKEDLFKHKRHLKTPQEAKVSKASKQKFGEMEKGKKAAENPTKENIENAAKAANKPVKTFSEELKEMREEVRKTKQEIKKGEVTPNTESKFERRMKKAVVGMGISNAVGVIQTLWEESFGTKLNSSLLKKSISVFSGVGSGGASVLARSFIRNLFDEAQADHLKTLRGNIPAWNDYIDKMQKKHGSAKVKRVLKRV